MEKSISSARERRRFPRLKSAFPIRFKTVDRDTSAQEYQTGTTCDVARGGLRFTTEVELDVGHVLVLHLTIPGSDRVIAALAETLRVTPLGDGTFETGVIFRWSGWHDGDMQREIADFVEQSLEGEADEVD